MTNVHAAVAAIFVAGLTAAVENDTLSPTLFLFYILYLISSPQPPRNSGR